MAATQSLPSPSSLQALSQVGRVPSLALISHRFEMQGLGEGEVMCGVEIWGFFYPLHLKG